MGISVRNAISNTLQRYSPEAILAFMGVNYYGHTVQTVSTGMQVKPDVVYEWLRSIRSDIRRTFKCNGGIIGVDGMNVIDPGTQDSVVQQFTLDPNVDNFN